MTRGFYLWEPRTSVYDALPLARVANEDMITFGNHWLIGINDVNLKICQVSINQQGIP
jgi:hypothetical protein